jgi:hypothetical protein
VFVLWIELGGATNGPDASKVADAKMERSPSIACCGSGKTSQNWHGHYHDTWQTLSLDLKMLTHKMKTEDIYSWRVRAGDLQSLCMIKSACIITTWTSYLTMWTSITWSSYFRLFKSTCSIEKVKNWMFDTIRDWRTTLENEIGERPIVFPNAIGCTRPRDGLIELGRPRTGK